MESRSTYQGIVDKINFNLAGIKDKFTHNVLPCKGTFFPDDNSRRNLLVKPSHVRVCAHTAQANVSGIKNTPTHAVSVSLTKKNKRLWPLEQQLSPTCHAQNRLTSTQQSILKERNVYFVKYLAKINFQSICCFVIDRRSKQFAWYE